MVRNCSLFSAFLTLKNLLWIQRSEFWWTVKKCEEHKLHQETTTCSSFEASPTFALNCKYGDCEWFGRSMCTANREASPPSWKLFLAIGGLSWSTIIFMASLDGCFQQLWLTWRCVYRQLSSNPVCTFVYILAYWHSMSGKTTPDKHIRIIQSASVYWDKPTHVLGKTQLCCSNRACSFLMLLFRMDLAQLIATKCQNVDVLIFCTSLVSASLSPPPLRFAALSSHYPSPLEHCPATGPHTHTRQADQGRAGVSWKIPWQSRHARAGCLRPKHPLLLQLWQETQGWQLPSPSKGGLLSSTSASDANRPPPSTRF